MLITENYLKKILRCSYIFDVCRLSCHKRDISAMKYIRIVIVDETKTKFEQSRCNENSLSLESPIAVQVIRLVLSHFTWGI